MIYLITMTGTLIAAFTIIGYNLYYVAKEQDGFMKEETGEGGVLGEKENVPLESFGGVNGK